MVSEAYDVERFLAANPLLRGISEASRLQLAHKIEIAFAKAGSSLPFEQDSAPGLVILRSGSVEIKDSIGNLKDRLSSGDILLPYVLHDHPTLLHHVNVLEDSLYYQVDAIAFEHLCADEKSLAILRETWRRNYLPSASVPKPISSRPTNPITDQQDIRLPTWALPSNSINTPLTVRDCMSNKVVSAPPDITVKAAAALMQQHKVSSLLVIADKVLLGIITDKDLRNRVLAVNLSTDTLVQNIMTPNPFGIAPSSPLHEAQMRMIENEIQHLAVLDATVPIGVISASDLLKSNNLEPLPLISAIQKGVSLEELVTVSKRLPGLVAKLIERNTRPSEIGEVITACTDALTRRLIQFAEERFGNPPCAYTWLAFGSQARQEQMLGSDQDNALILAEPTTKITDAYFSQFTSWVNSGLDQCGIVLCPGNIMAKNPTWRMTLEGWTNRFNLWIEQPDPTALLNASIFFDMRGVAGDLKLQQELQTHVLKKAQSNSIFLAHMAGNALSRKPPLGFFKTFVLEQEGEHTSGLDLKKRGTIPIVDIARNYALTTGIEAVNTVSRLRALRENNSLSNDLANSLIDAHEFIAKLRLNAQAQEFRKKTQVDNFLDPKDISPLLRYQLKEAFQWVREAQQAMRSRFYGGIR